MRYIVTKAWLAVLGWRGQQFPFFCLLGSKFIHTWMCALRWETREHWVWDEIDVNWTRLNEWEKWNRLLLLSLRVSASVLMGLWMARKKVLSTISKTMIRTHWKACLSHIVSSHISISLIHLSSHGVRMPGTFPTDDVCAYIEFELTPFEAERWVEYIKKSLSKRFTERQRIECIRMGLCLCKETHVIRDGIENVEWTRTETLAYQFCLINSKLWIYSL